MLMLMLNQNQVRLVRPAVQMLDIRGYQELERVAVVWLRGVGQVMAM